MRLIRESLKVIIEDITESCCNQVQKMLPGIDLVSTVQQRTIHVKHTGHLVVCDQPLEYLYETDSHPFTEEGLKQDTGRMSVQIGSWECRTLGLLFPTLLS